MNNDRPALEIEIHLSDSNIARYVQSDLEAAADIMKHLHPDKLFTQRQFILASDRSVTVYTCDSVARVDFVMAGFPDWPFHRNVIDILEITEDEFRERYDPNLSRKERLVQPGETMSAFGELEISNGERIFREIRFIVPDAEEINERLPQDRIVFFQQLFSAPSLHMRRRGGGAILVNPAHVVRMTFYPGPPDIPPTAWHADPVNHPWQS